DGEKQNGRWSPSHSSPRRSSTKPSPHRPGSAISGYRFPCFRTAPRTRAQSEGKDSRTTAGPHQHDDGGGPSSTRQLPSRALRCRRLNRRMEPSQAARQGRWRYSGSGGAGPFVIWNLEIGLPASVEDSPARYSPGLHRVVALAREGAATPSTASTATMAAGAELLLHTRRFISRSVR